MKQKKYKGFSGFFAPLRGLWTRIVNGYKQFYDNCLRKWVFVHRRVAEEMIGGPIPPGHEVHHINENKQDNRPENLIVLPKEMHQALHSAGNPVSMRRPYHYGTCPKCGGSGYIPKYSHVQGGICFLCWGSGRRG